MFSKFLIICFVITATCEPDQRVITTLKYSKYYVKPTVVNGKPAATGQVPYLVSIKEPVHRIGDQRIVWKNLCGGSIITEHKVLSAAHCFEGHNFYYKKHPSILRIVAGNLRTDIAHSGDTETNIINQWRKIDKVILHRNFNFPSNDIALVFLNVPLNFSKNVDYINTASKNIDYPRTCISAGFGRIGHSLKSRISPILLIARIHTLSKWKCSMIWEMNMNSFICSDSSIADVSRGDSGGPLVCKGTSDPNEKPNRDLLVGVVSGKNFDKTTLYTRVSAYKHWIAKNGVNAVLFGCNFMLITLLFVIYLVFDFSSYVVIDKVVSDRASSFYAQRISLTVQPGNAPSIHAIDILRFIKNKNYKNISPKPKTTSKVIKKEGFEGENKNKNLAFIFNVLLIHIYIDFIKCF